MNLPNRPLVLVVDDSLSNLALAREVLRDCGIVADAAGTAEEAETMATKTSYKAIALDIELPDRDGVSLARAIRGSRGGKS